MFVCSDEHARNWMPLSLPKTPCEPSSADGQDLYELPVDAPRMHYVFAALRDGLAMLRAVQAVGVLAFRPSSLLFGGGFFFFVSPPGT
jgi:hypothetical protein